MPEIGGYAEFEFDLPDALLERLITAFDSLASGPLIKETATVIPDYQGVYQLFYDDELVYIGKTDSDAGLGKRLQRHARTVLHRQHLHVSKVSFKAIRVFVFTAIDLEGQLIKHYKNAGKIGWNNSGFGSNDPGRRRDETAVKHGGFDQQFPIDIDEVLDFELPKDTSAYEVLSSLKDLVPYTFRFEGGAKKDGARSELEETIIEGLVSPFTTRSILSHVVSQLPSAWQATALPSRVILYRETNKQYPAAEIII